VTHHRPWVVELLAHPDVQAKIADEEHRTSYAEVRDAVRLRRLDDYRWHWDQDRGWRVRVEVVSEAGFPLIVIMAEVEEEDDVWVLRSAWRKR
jgi:hypothetical protein